MGVVIVQVCIVMLAASVLGFISYCKKRPSSSTMEDYFLIAPELQKPGIEKASKRFGAGFIMNSSRIRSFSAGLKYDSKKPERYFLLRQRFMDVFFLDSNGLAGETFDQLNWLEHVLASSSASWRVIVGHHDLEENSNASLKNMLLPLFLRHDVNVYVHDGEDFSCRNTMDRSMMFIGIGSQNSTQESRKNQADFILTRVTALEMEFILMNSNAQTVSRAFAAQRGRATF
ncbi:uncharacterized protein LOC112344410 isoform X2 [Selaginella moellendorffii]|uniref:uncharacterized protein LOC112344410 isoform X2 n=1 Tax=Selaginella moellendorffii TaxID=88036 RepID=UPI000D1C424C|nr:uncharacterized protein LOC112344410 isoform X2 [Selaginella moellendorffii]|eukprot:XP_024524852.1 uncharacterized protein LOC112344410 isoform X2 [Selaginella moellendorffii]